MLCHADAYHTIKKVIRQICHADAYHTIKKVIRQMCHADAYNTIHESVQLATTDTSQIINKDTIKQFFTHICPNKTVNWYITYCQQRRHCLLIIKEASIHYMMSLRMVPLTTEGRWGLILVRGGLRGVYMVPLTTEGSWKLILVRVV